MAKRVRLILAITVGLLALAVLGPLSAHEERTIGTYDVELGWRVEPAYTGLFNGPELFVHDENGDPVEGLELSLKLDVTFGPASKTLALYQVEDDPGHYTADLIPTRPGDYSFHVTGMMGDTAVDEIFTSADGQFGTVEPVSDIQFP